MSQCTCHLIPNPANCSFAGLCEHCFEKTVNFWLEACREFRADPHAAEETARLANSIAADMRDCQEHDERDDWMNTETTTPGHPVYSTSEGRYRKRG